jgi:hypothetical protein
MDTLCLDGEVDRGVEFFGGEPDGGEHGAGLAFQQPVAALPCEVERVISEFGGGVATQ